MYDHQLLKLVQSRHKVLLRVVLVFVVLLAFLNLGGTIQGYQNRQEYTMNPRDFAIMKKQYAKNHDTTFAKMSYSQYQEEQKYLIAPQDKHKLYSPSFIAYSMTIVSYAIPLLVGMAMAGLIRPVVSMRHCLRAGFGADKCFRFAMAMALRIY